jgi:hypothetical protein
MLLHWHATYREGTEMFDLSWFVNWLDTVSNGNGEAIAWLLVVVAAAFVLWRIAK